MVFLYVHFCNVTGLGAFNKASIFYPYMASNANNLNFSRNYVALFVFLKSFYQEVFSKTVSILQD